MRTNFAIVLTLLFATDLFASTSLWNPMRNLSYVEYAAGTALASAGNYEAARVCLEAGWLRHGKDTRFLSQLAGISYRNGNPEQAKKYLQKILRADPSDAYANEFLGTLFLLEKNLEAALKYWNRVEKPVIDRIHLSPLPSVDPELMDRALSVAPVSQLKREDYLASESRLKMIGIFKKQEFVLKPHAEDAEFDLIVSPVVKKSSLSSKMKAAVLVGEGVLSETITPEFINIGGSTVTSSSLISWDEFKNRFYTSLSFPFSNHPHSRIRLFTDTRKETWALGSDVNLLKSEAGIEFAESVNGRWTWSSGTRLSYRTYDIDPSTAVGAGLVPALIGRPQGSHLQTFNEGWLIEAFANFDVSLIRIPERRFTLRSVTKTAAGNGFGSISPIIRLENSFDLRWFPRAKGEDLEMNGQFRFGKIFGDTPFDSYFVLGVERDSDLRLRAHKSSIDKKGENPFGTSYLLWNWDLNKIVLDKTLFRLKIGPFLDVGNILGSEIWNGERWFVDTGMQAGFQVLSGPEFVLTYGKDLRNGRNVFYLSAKL